MTSEDGPRLVHTMRAWWQETAARDGRFSATRQFAQRLYEFGRESMPDRQRQRYGDIDYDWEYRVNTTGAAVGWRDRLLGEFLSSYQPTEPALFHEMMAKLEIDYSAFVFIDLGSGKGRALLMAAEYPFKRIIGVEVLPSLHHVAVDNIRKYHSDKQKSSAIESICGDARNFEFPAEPTVLYLFNPLPEAALCQVIGNLKGSVIQHPRGLYVCYHNPLLEKVLADSGMLTAVVTTPPYSIYQYRP